MDKEKIIKEHKNGSIVPVLACVLNQLCVSNDQLPFSPKESNSKFHALRIPYINLKEYLERIAKYSGCSSECLVLALVYIDRIIQGSQNFIVNSYCIHRLLITSVMLAAKFFDDHYYNNAYYAKVGGVTYSEMNGLEVEFLFMLNFDLFVTTETYKQYYDELWSHANSTPAHLCGCINAKVPLLILPRFDDTRKTPPTLLDTSDLDVDQDLDIVADSPPPSPTTPTLEIPTLSTHCGTRIPAPITTTTTATLPLPTPHALTIPHPSKSVIPQKVPLVSSSTLLTNAPRSELPATIPSSIPWPSPSQQHHQQHQPQPIKQHDRVIAPPLPKINQLHTGSIIHESTTKNPVAVLPFCGNTNNSFRYHQEQQQQQPPVTFEETPSVTSTRSNRFSIAVPTPNKSSSSLALKGGRDDVMLDIVADSIISPPSTDKQPVQTSMIVDKSSSSSSQPVSFYGDFPSFLADTEIFEEEEEEDQIMDSKRGGEEMYGLSPSFHPYGNNHHTNRMGRKSYERGGSGGQQRWNEISRGSNNNNRLGSRASSSSSHHHPSSNHGKRKENRGDTNLWQSIVLPVY